MMKQSKAALKEAKEFIQQKQYPEALNLCKEILDAEPSNYFANVFAGRCCFETGEHIAAEKYYQAAVNLDSANVLAWQGLVQLFEHMREFEKLAEACKRLTEIGLKTKSIENEKLIEISKKRAEALVKIGLYDCAIDELKFLQNDLKMKENLVKTLAIDLFSEVSRPLQKKTFDFLCNCFEANFEENRRKIDFLDFLLKQQKFEKVFTTFANFALNVEENPEVLKIVGGGILGLYIERGFLEDEEITVLENFLDKNEKFSETDFDAEILRILTGLNEFLSENFESAIVLLEKNSNAVAIKKENFGAFVEFLLGEIFFCCKKFEIAKNFFQSAIKSDRLNAKQRLRAKRFIGKCFLRSENEADWRTALEICESQLKNESEIPAESTLAPTDPLLAPKDSILVDEDPIQIQDQRDSLLADEAECHLRFENLEKAEKILSKISDKRKISYLSTFGWFLYLKGNFEKAKEAFETAISIDDSNALL